MSHIISKRHVSLFNARACNYINAFLFRYGEMDMSLVIYNNSYNYLKVLYMY